MLKICYWIPFTVCLLATSVASAQSEAIIGEHVAVNLETPHPYPAGLRADEPVWVDTIHHPGAVYIAVHFAEFELAPGDYVIVRSEDGRQSWRYSDLGRRDLGRHPDGFFATHLKGDSAIVELFSPPPADDVPIGKLPHKAASEQIDSDQRYGYRIDFYGRGYNDIEIEAFWDAGLGEVMRLPYPRSLQKAICGADNSREARCYQTTEANAYLASSAVARLVLNGRGLCTGWLVGDEGHLMTNEHCIGNQAVANQVDFEFMAEGATCATDCRADLACAGTIEASGADLIDVDVALDYALVRPATHVDLPAKYGYLQMRADGPTLGERIYIPQHPSGWGKRIAIDSTHPVDGGVARISSLTEPPCRGIGNDVGYFADTRGGTSGSPVLSFDDNVVVALHRCFGVPVCTGTGGARNRGVAIDDIIANLAGAVPNRAVCDGSGPLLNTETVTYRPKYHFGRVTSTGFYVYYGLDGQGLRSRHLSFGSSVSCTNHFFGGDPVPGQVKKCYLFTSGGWMRPMADEWGSFTLPPGTATRTYTRQGDCPIVRPCNNEAFGDPAPYFYKECRYAQEDTTVVTPEDEWMTISWLQHAPLSTTITGPFTGQTGVFTTFTANRIGGTPPFTYQWRVNGFHVSSGSSYSSSFSLEGDYLIQLTVTDSNSDSVSATRVYTTYSCPNFDC